MPYFMKSVTMTAAKIRKTSSRNGLCSMQLQKTSQKPLQHSQKHPQQHSWQAPQQALQQQDSPAGWIWLLLSTWPVMFARGLPELGTTYAGVGGT